MKKPITVAQKTRKANARNLDSQSLSDAKMATAEKLKDRRLDTKNYPPKSALIFDDGNIAFNTNYYVRKAEQKLKQESLSLDKQAQENRSLGVRLEKARKASLLTNPRK
jgi:hypothetical protein